MVDGTRCTSVLNLAWKAPPDRASLRGPHPFPIRTSHHLHRRSFREGHVRLSHSGDCPEGYGTHQLGRWGCVAPVS
jgi:hypothetical protein